MRSKLLSAAVVLLLATAMLAGCLGGADETEPASSDDLEGSTTNETTNETEEPEETGPTITRTWHNGSLEGASVPAGGWYCTPTSECDNSLEFEVPNGTQTVVVEAAWEADADAYLSVGGPDCEPFLLVFQTCTPSDSAQGSSPLAVTFGNEDAGTSGTWQATIWVDEVAPTQIEPTLVASVVEEGQLPGGYTALEDA